jgi:hypothetical protein
VKRTCLDVARSVVLGVVFMGVGVPATYAQSGSTESRPSAFTIDGDASVWVVAIRPDKTQDFERVMTRLREALQKSQKPERQRQASGWKVLKVSKPMPDGNIAYVHMINPVVPGADYAVLQILYDEFPEERQALYELYRGSFAQSLSLVAGSVAVDLTKTE